MENGAFVVSVVCLGVTDLGSSVLSICPQAGTSLDDKNNKFVATYRYFVRNRLISTEFRCQNQERKLNLMIRTTEGEYGDLAVTVVTSATPKAAKVIIRILQ